MEKQQHQIERKILLSFLGNNKLFQQYNAQLHGGMFMFDANPDAFNHIKKTITAGDFIDVITMASMDDRFVYLFDGYGAGTNSELELYVKMLISDYSRREQISILKTALDGAENNHDVTEIKNTVITKLSNIQNARAPQLTNVQILQKLTHRMESDSQLIGLDTGFRSFNKIIGGWIPENLIVLAARPGMGKTAVALNKAIKAARLGHKVLMFNIEMNVVDLMARLIAADKRAHLSNIMRGKIDLIEWHKEYLTGLDWLDNITIISDLTNVADVVSEIHYQKSTTGVDIVIIDYLQLLKGDTKLSKHEMVGNISWDIKMCAKRLEIPIILLSQLSRKVEERADKKPLLSDLRDSGEIEQNADVVIFLYRPEVYKIFIDENGRSTVGLIDIIVRKNRNGSPDEFTMNFLAPATRIEESEETPNIENDEDEF